MPNDIWPREADRKILPCRSFRKLSHASISAPYLRPGQTYLGLALHLWLPSRILLMGQGQI